MEAILIPLISAAGASAGTITAASGVFSALGTLGTVVSSVGSVVGGFQQQAMYEAQARQAQLRAQAEEVRYRQQGVMALDRTLSTAATIAARAGAGSIDPFSGSAAALTNYAFGKGFGEFTFAQESAALAREQGNVQAALYSMSGDQALMAGFAKGFGSVFSGLSQAGGIGGITNPPPTPTGQLMSVYSPAPVPLPPIR